ncbi:Non-canonical non-ribosomal peptide synthetase-like protein 2 [Elsinoe fawcettii]|nr:Non-canonical non-ribosomal peptide synthetase-like protein 2 [Elsinoe fawcettii]
MAALRAPDTPPEESPWTIDELIRKRAKEDPEVSLVSYPAKDTDYVHYNARQLDIFAYRVAQHHLSSLPQRASSAEKPKVVALLGISNLQYFITALALSKLGLTVLFLSTRLSDPAYLNLLDLTGCHDLLVGAEMAESIRKRLGATSELRIQEVVDSTFFLGPIKDETIDTKMDQHLEPHIENLNITWIIHSSGSTGLPKPIFQTHAAALRNYNNNFGMKGFITLPLYHAHGISSVFRSIASKKQIFIYPAHQPLTGPNLIKPLMTYDFEIFYGVPYALKLLSETEEGLRVLSRLKLVMFGGSSCPDELGDKLVQNGVKLISHYGTTETGQLMTSFREDGDLDWNYLRVQKSLKPFVRFEERGSNVYELVVLEGWPSKVATNRPDGAYATKDLFSKHPNKEDAYKWTGRLDDTLVLLNGEKVIPIPIEHTVRQNECVAEVVVFGAGKPQTGMFVIPAIDMSAHEIMQKITPSVEAANSQVPSYFRVAPEMIRVLPYGTDYPRTDKSTVIRAAFYAQFKQQIENTYEDALKQTANTGEHMTEDELRSFLTATIRDVMKLEENVELANSTDFFSLSMDSLQALRVHSAVIKAFNTNGQKVGQNVVFEHPNLDDLTSHLVNLATGTMKEARKPEEIMADLVRKYSNFTPHVPGNASAASTALVTGATGSLGAHVVAQLVRNPAIHEVYCLVRATSSANAQDRVNASLFQRRLHDDLSVSERAKIIALPASLGESTLGLDGSTLSALRSSVTHIIHLAWAVNFNWDVTSFEAQHIVGTHNLLSLALSSTRPTPPSMHFGSSVSAVSATPILAKESHEPLFAHAQGMGYARSKLVAENICAAAARVGLHAHVHRIGQIVGDTQHGIWNPTEAIPLMIQSATTIGCLPALDEYPTWLPVDVVASTILDLALTPPENAAKDEVFHVVNPGTFHWTRDLLPALQQAGLEFETVGQREWVRRLRESELSAEENPPKKLVDFFASKYDSDEPRKRLYFATDKACRGSRALHNAPRLDAEGVQRMVSWWREEGWRTGQKAEA